MSRDEAAMERRDRAHARGCRICPSCDGLGAIHDDPEVRGAMATCPKCNGDMWIDILGRPYDPDHPKNRN